MSANRILVLGQDWPVVYPVPVKINNQYEILDILSKEELGPAKKVAQAFDSCRTTFYAWSYFIGNSRIIDWDLSSHPEYSLWNSKLIVPLSR